jgi:ubiquinone/menaquinone biosynthesis C-methylase UbiE
MRICPLPNLDPEPSMNDSDERGPSPAQLFESFFGPSIFAPWTEILLERAAPQPRERILDLACATGIVGRRVAPLVGEQADVVGVDLSPEMLGVARERAEAEGVRIEWRRCDAADLDLPDDSFDLVLCQQGLQFFGDPAGALSEIRRVLDEGGRTVQSVWQPLERHPVYRALFEAEARHLGTPVDDLATPFVFGDDDRLRSMLTEAGFEGVDVEEHTIDVVFRDPETFVTLTIMAGAAVLPDQGIDDPDAREALIEAVRRHAEEVLERHRDGDSLTFPMPNYIATAFA